MKQKDVRALLTMALAIYAIVTLWTDAPALGTLAGVTIRWNAIVGFALGGWILGK